jgi:hypothetical protein
MPFQKIAIDRRNALDSVFRKLTLAEPLPQPEPEVEPPGEFKFPDGTPFDKP